MKSICYLNIGPLAVLRRLQERCVTFTPSRRDGSFWERAPPSSRLFRRQWPDGSVLIIILRVLACGRLSRVGFEQRQAEPGCHGMAQDPSGLPFASHLAAPGRHLQAITKLVYRLILISNGEQDNGTTQERWRRSGDNHRGARTASGGIGTARRSGKSCS